MIQKKNVNDFEFLKKWKEKDTEVFMKTFDIFSWWAEKNCLDHICSYLFKRKPLRMGDPIYLAGDKADKIYFLKYGDVEIYEKEKIQKRFILNDKEIIIKDEKKLFDENQILMTRLISPTNIFGVEEIIAGSPKRLFSCRAKSSDVIIFEMSKDRIFNELVIKSSNFLQKLKKYSCLTNETLARGFNLSDYSYWQKKSCNITDKYFTSYEYQITKNAIYEFL